MKREKLIQSITSHLIPVKRIFPSWIIFLIWALFASVTVLIFVWNRSENFSFLYIPEYKFDLVFAFLTVISCGFVAIYTSIPGNKVKGKFLFTPVTLFSFWVFTILIRFFLNMEASVSTNFSYHYCTKDILLMSVPSASVLIYIINRRLPLKKNWIGFWVVTASSSMSIIGVSFLCSNELPTHTLSVHILPVILVGLMGTFLGKLLFREKY